MKRKSKQNDTPMEILFPLFLATLTFGITKSLNKSVLVFIVGILILCAVSFTFMYIKNVKHRRILLNSGINIVDKMDGQEFEKFLMVHFERLGYKAKLTAKSNDYGADLILTKEGEKIVVQAKRWANKVGIEAVQQILGAKQYYKADRCIVAANNYFTSNAVNLAYSSGVTLWNRSKLIEIMNKNNGRESAEEVITEIRLGQSITCPQCNSTMVLKKGKYGSFYGCSNFPKCKYTKNII